MLDDGIGAGGVLALGAEMVPLPTVESLTTPLLVPPMPVAVCAPGLIG